CPPGKTWFTHWCLFTCFLRGLRVTYVDLKKKLRYEEPDGGLRQVSSKGWLDVIRVIREACISDRQLELLPPEAFSQFNASLNALVAGPLREGLPVAAAPGPVHDEWRPFNEERRHAPERIHGVFSAFLTALTNASAGRPHVIALDNADSILPEDF